MLTFAAVLASVRLAGLADKNRIMSDTKGLGALRGHVAILATNVIFGVNIPISKITMPDYVPSLGMAFFRTTGALLFFWLISLFVKWEKVPLRDLGGLALAAVFGILLNQMLFVMGLEFASPVEAAIVVTFTPILTMMLSALFLREPVTWLKAEGVFLGLSGAVLMIAGKYLFGGTGGQAGQHRVLGIVLCVVSGLSYAIYLTAFRNLVAKYKPVTVMRWMFLFSALFSVPFLMKTVMSIDYAGIPPSGYLMLAYTVFGATGVTYLLIPVAQKNLRPTVLSVYNYVQPVTASVLALILGKDGYDWVKIVATVLVFAGVFCVTRSKSRQQLEMEAHSSIRHWPSVHKKRKAGCGN